MNIFRIKPVQPARRLEDGYRSPNKTLNGKTLMLLDAVRDFPPELICSVLSAALRDKEGVPAGYMRRLAQDLDRHADELERSQ